MARVGIIGVGLMGGAMAQRLLDLGHAVWVRDVDAARAQALGAAGAVVADSPAALAAQVDLVVVAVVDGMQTREVLFGADGAVAAMRPRADLMLCPTVAPAVVEAAAAALAAADHGCIDAPMSGGPLRARDGSMSLMVACSDALWQRWQPLLAQLAAHCFRVGARAGDGARTKLVNNLLAAVNLAGAAEVMRLAERMGLDPAATLDVIECSSGQSWIGSERLRRVLAADPRVLAPMRLLAKDSALAMAAAQEEGLALPVGAAAAQVFAQALKAGLAEADDGALWRSAAGGPGPA